MRRVAAGVLVALALLVPATAQGQTDGDTAATSTVPPTTTDWAALSAPEPAPDTTTSLPPGDVAPTSRNAVGDGTAVVASLGGGMSPVSDPAGPPGPDGAVTEPPASTTGPDSRDDAADTKETRGSKTRAPHWAPASVNRVATASDVSNPGSVEAHDLRVEGTGGAEPPVLVALSRSRLPRVVSMTSLLLALALLAGPSLLRERPRDRR